MLALRALRLAGAFAEPQIVANSILVGSRFSNVYARTMLYGILEEVHRAVPLVRVDQHVDDLAQCAVGRQITVIKDMAEVTGITTFACHRLSLVISPKSTICCSDVKTANLLRKGLLELGVHFGVTRRTRDLGVDTGRGARRADGVMRKRLCKAAKRCKRLAVPRRHTKKVSSLHRTNFGRVPALGRWAWVLRTPPCKVSDRALRPPCVPSLVDVSRPVLLSACLLMRTPPCRQGLSASSSSWCFGTTPMNLSARAYAELGG